MSWRAYVLHLRLFVNDVIRYLVVVGIAASGGVESLLHILVTGPSVTLLPEQQNEGKEVHSVERRTCSCPCPCPMA